MEQKIIIRNEEQKDWEIVEKNTRQAFIIFICRDVWNIT